MTPEQKAFALASIREVNVRGEEAIRNKLGELLILANQFEGSEEMPEQALEAYQSQLYGFLRYLGIDDKDVVLNIGGKRISEADRNYTKEVRRRK